MNASIQYPVHQGNSKPSANEKRVVVSHHPMRQVDYEAVTGVLRAPETSDSALGTKGEESISAATDWKRRPPKRGWLSSAEKSPPPPRTPIACDICSLMRTYRYF